MVNDMMMPDCTEPLKTYKSYKSEKFNKLISRTKALKNAVNDSSLKEEDKKALLDKMRNEL